MAECKIKTNPDIVLTMSVSQAILLKGLVQNCPIDDPATRKEYEELFLALPSFQTLLGLNVEENFYEG